jgi:hypothetical protein
VFRTPEETRLAPGLFDAPPTPRVSTPTGSMGRRDEGFIIKRPTLRVPPVEGEIPIGDMRGQLLVNPELDRLPPIPPRRKVDEFSFVFNLLAIVGLVGLPLLGLPDNPGTQIREQPREMIPVREGLSVARTSPRPTLAVTASQKGYVNEPLPIGIWLNDASGKETVTIAGLAKGTELSLGTADDVGGWLLSAGDLDKTFVGPPRDFVGVMDASVKLSSAGGQLLESQVIRFEWIAKPDEVVRSVIEPAEPRAGVSVPPPAEPPAVSVPPPTEPPAVASVPPPASPSLASPVVPSLNPDEIAALIRVAEALLQHGDFAAARTMLKRAATAGDARAALELGMTFDQAFLTQWGVVGFAPDLAQAREWYDRALKLGSPEAARQLERLASTPK